MAFILLLLKKCLFLHFSSSIHKTNGLQNCRREQEKSNSKSKYVYIYLFRYEHWFHRLQIVQVPGNLYAKCILKSIRQITISINIQQRKNKIQFEMERKIFKHKQF